jgi:hypothetical protein
MTPEEAQAPRITARQIAGDAVTLLRTSFDAAWPWWFALFVLESAATAAAVLMAPPLPAPGHPPAPISPLAIGLTLGLSMMGIVIGAFALRALISGKAERPRLDKGFWAYGSLSLAAAAIWTAVTVTTSPLAERAIAIQPPATPPPELLPEMLGALVGFAVLALIFARLALWPVSKLMGEAGVGAAGSWRRMRGAVWPLIAATLVLVLPVLMLSGVLRMSIQTPTLPLAAAPVMGLVGAVEGALELAVMAAIWRARVGVKPVVSKPVANRAAD